MAVQFLLFLMTILLVMIFWELSKINSRIKKQFAPRENHDTFISGQPSVERTGS